MIAAATAIADASGLAAVTMRATAAAVGVEAMSLYNHVANRADLLDGMVDAVFAEIEPPGEGGPWREQLRRLAASTRRALSAHPWAAGLLDSRRAPGPATLRHHDGVLGLLRRSGFSPTMAVHVAGALDAYVYGSVMQERNLPLDELGGRRAASELVKSLNAEEFPHLSEIARERAEAASPPSAEDEFDFGLELLLGAIRPDEAGQERG